MSAYVKLEPANSRTTQQQVELANAIADYVKARSWLEHCSKLNKKDPCGMNRQLELDALKTCAAAKVRLNLAEAAHIWSL